MKGRRPTKKEKAHMDRVADLGCIVCRIYHGCSSPAELHHTRGKTQPGAHMDVIPLCAHHHRQGTKYAPSVHSVNGKWGYSDFRERYASESALLQWTRESLCS